MYNVVVGVDLTQKPWWNYLIENQKDLLAQSLVLLGREEETQDEFHDYAFVVFPAAKAYEGFLKKLFMDLGLISPQQFADRHLRIGRALNPDLPKRFRNRDWVYGRMAEFCGGEDLPKDLWETWRLSRNLIFHWFPQHKNFISLDDAREKVWLIIRAIDRAFAYCRIDKRE